ncbi:MAG: PKD domain-containing protein [Anaerolineae bacterium]
MTSMVAAQTPDPNLPDPQVTQEVVDIIPTAEPTQPIDNPDGSVTTPNPTDPTPDVPPVDPTEPAISTPEVTQEVTPEVTQDPAESRDLTAAAPRDLGEPIAALFAQTYCQMDINDAGDANPFTYGFNVINANNIASVSWDFGDTTTSTLLNTTHTYTVTGSYVVTLTCTPSDGSGDIVLKGGITIGSGLTVGFHITPAVTFSSVPFTIASVNTSTGTGLTYQWKISTSNNPADPGIYSYTTENFSQQISAGDVAAAVAVSGGYPAYLYVYLTVTDVNSVQGFAFQQIAITAEAPLADFTVTPVIGTAPLTITVDGFDLGAGPIDEVHWDITGGGQPDQIDAATDTGLPASHNFTLTNESATPYTITMRYRGPGLGVGVYNTVSRQVIVAPSAEPVQAGFTWEITQYIPGTGTEVCFTNTSTGPVATVEWDFENDGLIESTSMDVVVCHVYATEDVFTAKLLVYKADPSFSSTASAQISVSAPPIASFTVSPGVNITWGTALNFTDTSTGSPDSWAWDFNGDGTTDSTQQNPSGVLLSQLGANPIRLTVTKSSNGLSSFAEQIVFVARLAVTCSISGNFTPVPGSGSLTYTANVNNLNAGSLTRTIAYNWQVLDSNATQVASGTGNTINVNWDALGFGTFTINLNGLTSDGASCSDTQAVSHAYQALTCDITIAPSTPQYADGQSYTLSVNTNQLNGRPISGYQWYVANVPNPDPNNSADWTALGTSATQGITNTTNTAGLPTTFNYRVDVLVDNTKGGTVSYSPATSNCRDTETYTIQQWPTLTCNFIGGTGNPLPVTPSFDTRSYTYTANVSNVAGRDGTIPGTSISYSWTASTGVVVSQTGNTIDISWPPATLGSAQTVQVTVTVTNPDGTQQTCNMTRSNITPAIPQLACSIAGDDFTTVGETTPYTRTINNLFGRTLSSFTWAIDSVPTGATLPTVNGLLTDNPLSLTFIPATAGLNYDLQFSAGVDATTVINPNTGLPYAGQIPASTCNPHFAIGVYNPGVGFQCESIALTGNAAPTGNGNVYAITMDNTNTLPLTFSYYLIYPGDDVNTDTQHLLDTNTGITIDGVVNSDAFTLAQLGPLGTDNYHLRVDVIDGSGSTLYTCSNSIALQVGVLTAHYQYAAGGWTNSAVPVGQSICITNDTTETPSFNALTTYAWNINGSAANNSLGGNDFTGTDLPACVSFSVPGTYRILLSADIAGRRNSSYYLDFNVYGLQNIFASRSAASSSFGNTNQSFTAVGTNIFAGSYQWDFWNTDTNTHTFRSQQNPTLNLPAGHYTATVTGNGNLGLTQAQIQFILLAPNALAARFTASQYTGLAPMHVCFTDKSIADPSHPITLWEWDLDGDNVFEISSATQINPCADYLTPGQITNVHLHVFNGLNDTASVSIRTYTADEALNTFTIQPQGNGQYCFTAVLAPGFTVTGWDFGDGTTGPAINNPCHTYGASGDYFVKMFIVPPGGTPPGTVERPVTVPPGNAAVPTFSVQGFCDAVTAEPYFVVSNTNNTAMTTSDVIRMYDVINPGSPVLIATDGLLLPANGSQTYHVPTGYHIVRLVAVDNSATVDVTQTCQIPPQLHVTPYCDAITHLPYFRVSNDAPSYGPMDVSQNYVITDSGSNTIDSGSFQLATGAYVDIPVPAGNNPYDTYTFFSDGTPTGYDTLNVNHNCNPVPVMTVQQICGSPLSFTITNTGGPMLTSVSYTVTNVTEGTTAQTGTISGLASGGQQTITLTAADDVYDQYNITTSGGFVAAINVSPTPCARPAFTVQQVCAYPLQFTVTNTGGQMYVTANYTVTDDTAGTTAQTGTINLLAPNGQQTITLGTGNDPYNTYSVAINGGFVTSYSQQQTPCARPAFSAVAVCGSPLGVTVTNTSGATLTGATYTIHNDTENYDAATGSLTLASGANTTLNLTASDDPYDTYSITINNGFVNVLTQTLTPCARPVFTVQQVCGYPLTFTVTNTGGQMYVTANYTVTNVTEGTTAQTGTINLLAPNGQQTLTLTASDDVYDTYSVSISGGFVTTFDQQMTPCARPVFTVQQVCGYPLSFTVTNTGGQMYVTANYTITNVTEGTTAQTGTINLLVPNGQQTLTLTTNDDPYDQYQIDISGGFVTPLTTQPTPCERPAFTVQTVCAYPLQFTLTNIGGQMYTTADYTITNVSKSLQAQIGTISGLAPNGQQTFTLTVSDDPYDQYQVDISGGFVTVLSVQPTPCERPGLQVTTECSYPIVFTVTNTGGAFLTPTMYLVTNGSTPVAAGEISLAKGAHTEVVLEGRSPYVPYTFQTSGGFVPSIVMTHTCGMPALTVTSTCDSPAGFTVTNTGSEMLASQPFTLTWNGQDITPASNNSFKLLSGASVFIPVPAGYDLSLGVTFNSGLFDVNAFKEMTCESALRVASAFSANGTARIGGPVCGYDCPTFRLYHTDETGDWEIFRLDGADATLQQTFRQNLSFGVGEGVNDTSPSLSPNTEWIAFASNRDGNWEIYVASTGGNASSVQRVTINTTAIDTDPVWGPNNYVVFETTRNGNWDLYAADMTTGEVFPLVDDAANDINAFWSPNGESLIFQSDRPDENGVRQWQIYALNVYSGVVTRLSDGTSIDVDPQYSNNGSMIVYRSYTADGANSVLMLMNSDGSNKHAITTAGEDATNPAWSPQDHYIAYQSNLDGDLDIFVYEVATGATRKLTDNTIRDYAPTWECTEDHVIFTSEVGDTPDIYRAPVQPMNGDPMLVDQDPVERLTYEPSNDIYPEGLPSEENASREGQTVLGAFGTQTIFLQPDPNLTLPDISIDGEQRDGWQGLDACFPHQ